MSTEIVRSGQAVCIYEPNGEYNLPDFRRNCEYTYEFCHNIFKAPYYRIYYGGTHKTLAVWKFLKFFEEKE